MSVPVLMLIMIVGFAILIKGADWLVDGAVELAERLGLSPLIIGLTIVAMGTSAPEVAASIAASLADSGDIAVGNVYGSNIANLALVGGLCALIRPITVHSVAIWRDIPLMLLSALLLKLLMFNGVLGRPSALVLIVVFAVILYSIIRSSRSKPELAEDLVQQDEIKEKIKEKRSLPVSLFYLVLGFVSLAVGARLSVNSAAELGIRLGLSQAVVGMTIVAVGTSLPELVTCMIASFRKQDDLSIGNLVGSNIFNTLLVLGAAGLTRPLTVNPQLAGTDYWIMMAVSVIFSMFVFGRKQINRSAGITLSAIYITYLVFLFYRN